MMGDKDIFGQTSQDQAQECFDLMRASDEPSNGIEIQEKLGQARFVKSESLPIRIVEYHMEVTQADLGKHWGVKFLDVQDDLFVKVELPEGWEIVPSNHAMWSDLKDDKGRNRAGLFYKAACYDRKAHLGLTRRFTTGVDNNSDSDGALSYKEREALPHHAFIKDSETIIWKSDSIVYTNPDKSWDERKKLEAIAKDLLKKHYPNYEEPFSYWDEDTLVDFYK